jgi:GNAT superfamily N-acetyltransferase
MLGNTGYYEYEVTDGKYWSPSIVAEEEWKVIWIMDLAIANVRKNVNIDLFYVHKDYRGKWVGSELLSRAKEIANRFALESITLQVFDYNTDGIKAYENMWFKQIGFMKYKGWYKWNVTGMLQMWAEL